MEAECLTSAWRNEVKIATRFLQKHKGAIDIGLDEIAGGIDRAVNMGFGREVQNRIRVDLFEQVRTVARLAMSPRTNL